MQADVLKFEEAEPLTLPTVDGDPVDPAIWRRIESFVCYRWTPRQACWVVRGPGLWRPHLEPLSAVTVDVWDDVTFTWSAIIAEPSPVGGFDLPRCATYRITGTVGDTPNAVPPMLYEAYARLWRYSAEVAKDTGPIGASSYSENVGELTESVNRKPDFVAKALQHSGAADLLREYRMV